MKNEFWAFAGLMLLITYIVVTGNIPFFGSVGAGVDDGDGAIEVEVTQPDKACGSTTMTVDFRKKYAASTDMTSQNATVYINGDEKGVISEGSTFTAQGGDMLTVYYALDAPTTTTYYAEKVSGEIPCTGQTAAFMTSAILSGDHEVYEADTGLSVTIMNTDSTQNAGSAGSTSGSNQSISTGQTKKIDIELSPTYEDGYGVADGSTLACQFNDTVWDQSEFVASLGGSVLGEAKYVPSSTRFPVVSTDFTTKYWAFPAIDGKTTTELDILLSVKADDTNQPVGEGADSHVMGANINCTLFDTDYYVTDDGEVKIDIEDRDDNSNIGSSTDFAFSIWFE